MYFDSKKRDLILLILTIVFPIVFMLIIMHPIDWGIVPGYHGGDDAGGLFNTKTVMEYGYYSSIVNNHFGYPFGIDLRTLPAIDLMALFLIKLFSLFTDDAATVVTLIYFATFMLTAFVTYIVLKKLNVNSYIAFIIAQLYAFIPFHMITLAHMSLNFYYMFPIAIFYSIKLATDEDFIAKLFVSKKNILLHATILIFSVQTSLYMIVFFLLIIGVGLISYILQKGFTLKSARVVLIPFVIFIGIGLNWHTVIYTKLFADLPSALETNHRSINDSEHYGGRLSQLLLPLENHRVSKLGQLTKDYYRAIHYVNVTENTRQYLGLISGVMFLFSLFWLLCFKNKLIWQQQINFLSVLNIALFFWLTIGGFGVLFANSVTPIVRCWNRLSIAINGVSLVILALFLQACFSYYVINSNKKRILFYIGLVCLLSFGLFDHSANVNYYNTDISANYSKDKAFYKELNNSLPINAPVYQLPYVPLPYGNKLSYKQLLAPAYAPNLRWNVGSTYSSLGGAMYRYMENLPVDEQGKLLRKMNFQAIVVYKDAYLDNWDDFYTELHKEFGEPIKTSDDGLIYIFKIDHALNESYINFEEVFRDYLFDLDFSKDMLVNVSGFSGIEEWGRWTEGKTATLQFLINLPRKFRLEIIADGFANNSVSETKILLGDSEYAAIFNGSLVSIEIDNKQLSNTIVFLPPHPISPSAVTDSKDERILGIGLRSLKITEIE